MRKLSFIGHTIRDGGVRAGKGHETGQVNGKLCSGIPNTSYRSPKTSCTVYAIIQNSQDRSKWAQLVQETGHHL